MRDTMPFRFAEVWCSQCGQSFGPANEGFSRCQDHRPPEVNAAIAARDKQDEINAAAAFVNVGKNVMKGQIWIARGASKTMAKRIANALNKHKPNSEGV